MAGEILVPVDDSPPSSRALEFALSTFPDGDIVALHAINPSMSYLVSENMPIEDVGRTRDRAEERGSEVLAQAEAQADDHGVSITTTADVGDPARVIVSYADENDVDHIVMGSHGREGIERVLLGSVAEKVVRRTPADVTVIR